MSRDVTIRISAIDNASGPLHNIANQMGAVSTASGPSGAAGAMNALGRELQGAVLGFGALQLAGKIGELREVGQQVQTATRAFIELNGGTRGAEVTLSAMRAVTRGAVDDLTLMSSANRLLMMDLAGNASEAARLTEIAITLGRVMGKDASQAIEDFSLLLSNRSIPRLDNFGISAARVRQRVEELKDAGIELEQAFTMAVIEEGERSIQRLGEAAAASVSAWDLLGARLENVKNRLADIVFQAGEALAQLVMIPWMQIEMANQRQAEYITQLGGQDIYAAMSAMSIPPAPSSAVAETGAAGAGQQTFSAAAAREMLARAETAGMASATTAREMLARAETAGAAVEVARRANPEVERWQRQQTSLQTAREALMTPEQVWAREHLEQYRYVQQSLSNLYSGVGRSFVRLEEQRQREEQMTIEERWLSRNRQVQQIQDMAYRRQMWEAYRYTPEGWRDTSGWQGGASVEQQRAAQLSLYNLQQSYASIATMAAYQERRRQEEMGWSTAIAGAQQQASIRQAMSNIYSGVYGGPASLYGGTTAQFERLEQRRQEDIRRREKEAQEEQARAEALRGLVRSVGGIAERGLDLVEGAARMAGRIHEAMEQAAAAARRIPDTLDEWLGRGKPTGIAGELYRAIAGQMAPEGREQFMRGVGLTNWRDEFISMIAGLEPGRAVEIARAAGQYMATGGEDVGSVEEMMARLGYYRGRGERYTVKPGETLSAISARMGIPVDTLMARAGITDPGRLRAGAELRLGEEWEQRIYSRPALAVPEEEGPVTAIDRAIEQIGTMREVLTEALTEPRSVPLQLELMADLSALSPLLKPVVEQIVSGMQRQAPVGTTGGASTMRVAGGTKVR